MENIYKQLLKLMTLDYFKSYRLMVTEDVIDIKLTPKNNRDAEITYSMRNSLPMRLVDSANCGY